jgi:DNA-binding transcriptional LysR family regulator
MYFTLRQMEIMRAVVRTGSISDAARFLSVSQPSISATLKQCTEQAQFSLFQRVQGRITPTEETLALLPGLDQIFDCVEEVHALANDLRSGEAGAVRIAATHAIALSILPEAIRKFQKKHRNVRVTIRTMLSRDVVDEMGAGRIDLGLVMSPHELRGAYVTDLWLSKLICAAPADHPITRHKNATPRLLNGYPLISFSRSLPLGQLIDDAFHSQGVTRRLTIEVGPSIMALRLVEQGLGCAVVDPFSASRYVSKAIRIIPFKPHTKITAQLVTHTTRPLSRTAKAFIDELKNIPPP